MTLQPIPYDTANRARYKTDMVARCGHLLAQLPETIEELAEADQLNDWSDRLQEHENACWGVADVAP